MFAFPVLLGDIGGTNARFAVLPAPGETVQLLPRALTAQTPDPVGAIRIALEAYEGPVPRSAIIAVATRVDAPAIRLGWVLAPSRFVAGIVEEKRLSCRGTPGLDQEALALLMESGRFDRHLRRVREIYRARRDVLAAEAERAFGPDRLHGLAAGCHALLRLPDVFLRMHVPSRKGGRGGRVAHVRTGSR